MKKLKNIGLLLLVLCSISSCILEDVEPEYDIIGAVGTISDLTASTTNPTVGQTVTFTVTFYSEHENARELKMNRLEGTVATTLENRTFTSWNREDSYVETFQYVVPDGTAGTSIVIEFELVSESNFSRTRNITLQVSE
ncbi:hypothetical protein [Cecembia sp.]|uniref:hypothetical protein n=1 Tax=Cecembia sp. TaxID=1898110 RepID=UPI0025B8BE52|nr:hypothetical protein [Cecembia sp.]